MMRTGQGHAHDRGNTRASQQKKHGFEMDEVQPVVLALADHQVASILSQVSGGARLPGLLADLSGPRTLRSSIRPLLDDPRYSRSTLRALMVLEACPPENEGREVTAVAKELGLSPATAYRYVSTWEAVGLLERDPKSRRYRRAPAEPQ